MTLYFEDLTTGMRLTSETQMMDEARIKAFAAEFDPQFFHLDDEAAKGSLFGGLAASGWHTAAATMRLLVDAMPLAGGIIGTGGELSWLKPVRAGDTLQVFCEVMELIPSRSRADRGSAEFRVETRNQRGEVVQLFRPRCVVMRRPV